MKKILIVEDDQKIALVLAIRLKAAGHEVATAYDGVTGVSLATKFLPDLIVLDLNMPAGGGLAVAQSVQNLASTAGTPILVISASQDPELLGKAEKMPGVVGLLAKPYDPDLLNEKINKLLGEPLDTTHSFE